MICSLPHLYHDRRKTPVFRHEDIRRQGVFDDTPSADGIYLSKSEKKLAKLQRRLSRKSKGSRNRDKARIRVARLHEKIANQRNDYIHKLTTQLVRDYHIICVESLNVQGMMKNHSLAKAIAGCLLG